MSSSCLEKLAILMPGIALLAVSGCGRNEFLGPVANADTARAIRDVLPKPGTADEAGVAAASTGTGWATLRGRFVFDGTPPQRQPYNVTKDLELCTAGGRAPLQETLVVDSASNGIQYVVVFLRNASRVHESAQPTQPTVFDQKLCVFLPHVVAAAVGQPVELKNSDPMGHNTKFGSFNQIIEAGKKIEYKAQQEAAMPLEVSCSIHPWMRGYFLPRKNGYFAVTAADGSFEIANLPAGEALEFQAWHESAAGTGGSLVPGTPETRELDWSNRGRFKVTLEPDQVKEISVTVPATAFNI
jgi:hypothetical protein